MTTNKASTDSNEPQHTRADSTNGSPIQFVAHHPIGHSLSNKTNRFNLYQMTNILGLLKIFNHTLFVQLRDIDWISAAGNNHQNTTIPTPPEQPSRWRKDETNPPTISQTRALAAALTDHQTSGLASANPHDTNTTTPLKQNLKNVNIKIFRPASSCQ
jgi:hypothetical protein